VLNAIALDPIGNDTHRFDYLAQPVAGAAEGTRTAGTISTSGEIAIEQQAAAGEPMCPICLARGTTIDTPLGPVPVEQLRIGHPVWTIDGRGRRIEATVIAVGSMPAPAGHRVVRSCSPTAGRSAACSRTGETRRLRSGRRWTARSSTPAVDYQGARTYDIVASGPTGRYWTTSRSEHLGP
jgi:hypothetical protein